MRSLLVSEIFPPKVGGSGSYAWELYRRLPRDRYVVAAGEDPEQATFDATHDLHLHRVPLTFPTRFLRPSSLPTYRRAWSRLHRIVRAEDIGWAHAGRCVPEGVLASMLKCTTRTPFITFAHGEEINPSNIEASPRWYRRRVYGSRELAWMVGLVLRNASLIVASSQNARRILIDRWGLPEARICILHPGVDVARFCPAAPDPAVRRELGWGDRPVVLTVGRLQKRKGHDTLISALPTIRRSIPDVLCVIVGDGEERPALERLAETLELGDAVRFLGEVDDRELVRCYQQCDLFVLANRAIGGDIEGIGIVLLEAQACGKPVIAGNSGGTRETMQTPETGLVVDCEDPGELAAAITALLADRPRREQMGRRARRWVEERFDWDRRAGEADALFREFSGSRRQ